MVNNPFGPQQGPVPYSYVNLQKRMLKHVQAAQINDQIFSLVQKSFEKALLGENIALSAPEKKRMLAQILKQVLTDMLAKLEDTSKS
jgi:hypothetical protein